MFTIFFKLFRFFTNCLFTFLVKISVNKWKYIVETEDEGEVETLKGQIKAAITALEVRRSRPEKENICKLLFRVFGQPEEQVLEELEKLVETKILAKKEDKMGTSYHIIRAQGEFKIGKITVDRNGK